MELSVISLCDIWGPHRGVSEDLSSLGCYTVLLVNIYPRIGPEDDGTAFVRNVGNYLPLDAEQYLTRLESSQTLCV
jgi:hypothetical protein